MVGRGGGSPQLRLRGATWSKRCIQDESWDCEGVSRRVMWEVGWTGYSGLFSPLLSGVLLSPTGKLLFIPQSPLLVGPCGPVLWLGKSAPHPLPGTSTHPPYRPTSNSSRSPARGRNCLQMSMVKSVLLLLKMEVNDDMSAAIITAIISPRRPVGQGQVLLEPAACWQ